MMPVLLTGTVLIHDDTEENVSDGAPFAELPMPSAPFTEDVYWEINSAGGFIVFTNGEVMELPNGWVREVPFYCGECLRSETMQQYCYVKCSSDGNKLHLSYTYENVTEHGSVLRTYASTFIPHSMIDRLDVRGPSEML